MIDIQERNMEWKFAVNRIIKDITEFKWAIVAFGVYCIIMQELFESICPMVIISGFPCPGCGITRAIVLILIGQFAKSFSYNPFAIFWIFTAVYFVYKRYLKGERVKGIFLIFATLCIAMVIYYLYRMLYVFPSSSPMLYSQNNIIFRFLHLFE